MDISWAFVQENIIDIWTDIALSLRIQVCAFGYEDLVLASLHDLLPFAQITGTVLYACNAKS